MPSAVDPFRTASALAGALRSGEETSRAAVEAVLERIAAADPGVHAIVTVDADRARREADAADAARARGHDLGPLHGLPMTVKDCLETEGLRTTCGAPWLAEHVPARDADAVGRLRGAGAIVVGKSNLPTMAMDCQSYNPLFPTTVNPWDASRTPGGSSGGAAAALAAGLVPLEVGSDLGGSIRIPASWCGVYGLKPSFGVVPQRGHIPPPPGIDAVLDIAVVGPMGRHPDDLELALSVLAGPEDLDAVGVRIELPAAPERPLGGYRVAVWPTDERWTLDRLVADVLDEAVAEVRRHAAVTEAAPASLDESLALARQVIQGAIAHAIPDEEYEELARRAAGAGSGDDSAPVQWARNITQSARQLNAARDLQRSLRRRWARFFEEHDILLTPVMRTTAIPHDHSADVDSRTIVVDGAPVPYGDQFAWLQAVGLVYVPAVVAPVGVAADGLPVGIQIVAPMHHDRRAIAFARALARHIGGFVPPPAFATG